MGPPTAVEQILRTRSTPERAFLLKDKRKWPEARRTCNGLNNGGLWIYTERKLVQNKHVMTGMC